MTPVAEPWLPGLWQWSWVDWALAAVLLASVLIGLVRGFVFEVLSLLGWVVAWVAAQWAAPALAPHLPVGTPGSGLNIMTAFLLVFIAALIGWTLLARLVRRLVHATPLSLIDRVLGAGFGMLRGAVLLLLVGLIVTWTPAAQSQAWRTSQGARWLALALQAVKPMLPQQAAGLLNA